MKWVVDECVSIKWPNEYSGSNYIKSIDILGPGVKDSNIMSVTRKLKRGLVTADNEFANHAIWCIKTVIYHKSDGTRFKMKLTRRKLRPMVTQGRRITNYLRENDKVVIP